MFTLQVHECTWRMKETKMSLVRHGKDWRWKEEQIKIANIMSLTNGKKETWPNTTVRRIKQRWMRNGCPNNCQLDNVKAQMITREWKGCVERDCVAQNLSFNPGLKAPVGIKAMNVTSIKNSSTEWESNPAIQLGLLRETTLFDD